MALKIFITGGTGFVGSHLAQSFLQDGHTVDLLVRESSDISCINRIKDNCGTYRYIDYQTIADALKITKPDVVIHCASCIVASHQPTDIAELIDSNIKFPSMLLEAMSNTGIVNFINTGTCWQHYQNADYNPVNLYAATKQSFEQILEYYLQIKKVKSITLKLFDTYGPEDTRNKLIPFLIEKIRSGGEVDLSPGDQEVSFVHIDDIISAYKLSIKELVSLSNGESKEYGIGSSKVYKLKELIMLIEERIPSTHKKHKINIGARKYREREVMTTWKDYHPPHGWYEENNIIDHIISSIKSK